MAQDNWLFTLIAGIAGRVWNAIGPFVKGTAICLVVFYAWFGFVEISVTNESPYDLKGVILQRYALEGDRRVIWVEDLEPGETEWRYTFPGERGIFLRYRRDGKEVRTDCKNGSFGSALSVEFRIEPDGTSWCRGGDRF